MGREDDAALSPQAGLRDCRDGMARVLIRAIISLAQNRT